MNGLAHDLEKALDGEVGFDAYTRHLFSRDASMYTIRPLGVAFPQHAGDVAAGVPVKPQGVEAALERLQS